ncbi:glycosyltransferase family 4 protein [Actinoalloteichus spitiensis]|uniref:glycosyltransferase family 4 protein n=1 Tax=Actinoalloteichus spitiensis TaxID=252394 RepID=UPI00037CF70D|nr:glycosyltransferase family 4 protein [Actinoalloteichus spitiensis]
MTSAPSPAVDYDLCVAVNYYAPYVSGLTEVARVVAEGLAERGWRVAVVAARHDPALPLRERLGGVDVHRTPVVATVGRGTVSPSFASTVRRVARRSRLLHLHLPMLESAAVLVPRLRVPVVSTYHIDLWLPPGLVNRIATGVVRRSVRTALRRSTAVVVNSEDQARHSEQWATLSAARLTAIPAPCLDRSGGEPGYRETTGPHIGFLGRMVPDKGLEYLVRAFGEIEDPDARLLLGGDYETVAGGSVIGMVRAAAARDDRIRVLGLLRGREINDFYSSVDVFALPSVAESFGIAQAEAMMCGVPSVTTDLPGGRFPVLATGMGEIVPPRDVPALREALLGTLAWDAATREAGRDRARQEFGLESCLDRYENLFRSLLPPAGHGRRAQPVQHTDRHETRS